MNRFIPLHNFLNVPVQFANKMFTYVNFEADFTQISYERSTYF
jgi:hypothetical protein